MSVKKAQWEDGGEVWHQHIVLDFPHPVNLQKCSHFEHQKHINIYLFIYSFPAGGPNRHRHSTGLRMHTPQFGTQSTASGPSPCCRMWWESRSCSSAPRGGFEERVDSEPYFLRYSHLDEIKKKKSANAQSLLEKSKALFEFSPAPRRFVLQQPVWANVHGDLKGLLSSQKSHRKLQHGWKRKWWPTWWSWKDKSSRGECLSLSLVPFPTETVTKGI